MAKSIKDKLQLFPIFLCVTFKKISGFPAFSSVQATSQDGENLTGYNNTQETDEQKSAFKEATNGFENCSWYLISAKTLDQAKLKIKNAILSSKFIVKNNSNKIHTYLPSEYHIYFKIANSNSVLTIEDINNIEAGTNSDIDTTIDGGLTITQHPSDTKVKVGDSAILTVKIESNAEVNYQWQYKKDLGWIDITTSLEMFSGYNTESLIIATTTDNQDFLNKCKFQCKISNKLNPNNSKTSSEAILTIIEEYIIITSQPNNAEVYVGNDIPVTFSVSIADQESDLSYSYRWQYRSSSNSNFYDLGDNGMNYQNSATNTLSIYNTPLEFNNYAYRCYIKDSLEHYIFSDAAILTVSQKNANINISSQPSVTNVKVGQTAEFSVEATAVNGDTLKYQWMYYDANNNGPYEIENATSDILSMLIQDETQDNYRYGCRITDQSGNMATSYFVYLYITPILTVKITTQPSDQIIIIGGTSASFSIVAENAQKYQWQVNYDNEWKNINNGMYTGGAYGGAESSELSIAIIPGNTEWDNSKYRCIVSNLDNDSQEISTSATLTIEKENEEEPEPEPEPEGE